MALDPHTTLSSSSSLAPSQKHELIEAYLRRERSEEEIELLKTEMKQMLLSLQHRENTLASACRALTQFEDHFSRGAHSILATIKNKTRHTIEKAKSTFNTTNTEDLSDYSDSDSDSDSDIDNV